MKKENIQEELAANLYKKNVVINKSANKNLYLCEIDFAACLYHLPVDIIDELLTDMNLEMINNGEIRSILKKLLEFLPKISDTKDIMHELGSQFVELAMREIAEDNVYNEALKNKRQIELNYLKKRQNELIDLMRTTTDKTAQVSILQELNNLTKLIAGKNKDGE